MRPEGPIHAIEKPESELAKDIKVMLKPIDIKRWAEVEKIIKVEK